MGAVFHNIGVFFGHLAAVGWGSLGLALLCHFTKLCCVSRAWHNIIDASYPEARVPQRTVTGALFARVGINAIVPARGGDVAALFLVKRRVAGSSIPTLGTTLIVLTLFDMVAASCFILWALAAGELPGRSVLSRLPGFDFRWLFEHFRGTLIAVGIIVVVIVILLLWFAEQLFELRRRIAQGFAILGDKSRYLRTVVVWQVADWTLRLATIFFFLRAFHVPATLHNAILVQVTQSLAVLFPISPSGIGTEQALLLYIFSGTASKTTLLSFSVGMRVTLILFNALLGFTALFLMLRTLRWRRHVDADPEVAAER
jgi:uncharacterized membrane protein YbhN (UPF0104 family)